MQKLKFVLIFLIAIFVGAMTIQPVKKYRAKVSMIDFKNEMLTLRQNDVDIAGVNIHAREAEIIVTQQEIDFLEKIGIRIVSVKDIVAPDKGYKTPDEIQTILHDFAQKFPGISHLESVGKSVEGRDIWALKISDNPEAEEADEPAIFFNGMHHAREVMSPEVPLDIIETLLMNYSVDEQITNWVNSYEIWVLPMLNVDGNQKVWDEDAWWRKNTNFGHGVDINRNYTYRWGDCGGSSGSKSSETYRGASPGSEPETQVLMSLVERIRPVFSISFHSFSELVLYPYGCNKEKPKNADVIEPIGQQMAALIPGDNGNPYYTAGYPWDILYPVDGDDISWAHSQYQVIPYVIELNLEFQPSYDQYRDKTVRKLRPAWKLLLSRLESSAIYGRVLNHRAGVPTTVTLIGKSYEQTYNVTADGTFFVVVNPGEYQLKTKQDGKEQITKITVGNTPLRLSVEL